MALLAQGSTGQEVKNLQTALNYHLPNAVPRLAVNGIFGPKTRARVVQFQTKYRLKSDGLVGPETHRALYCFVDCTNHLLTANASLPTAVAGVRSFAVGDGPAAPQPLRLPPLPRLQLPFPPRLLPMPAPLQPPRLEIDPRLLLLARITKFELEAGQQTSFTKDLTKPTAVEREVFLISDLKATVWSKPIGKHLELSAGAGAVVEQRVRPTSQTEFSVYIFGKAEVKDLAKVSVLDLAKIAAEAQVVGKPGKNEPPDMTVDLSAGPEVEILNGRVSIGTSAYVQYQTNGVEHIISAGGKISATGHF